MSDVPESPQPILTQPSPDLTRFPQAAVPVSLPDANPLLDAANSTSEKVSVLHLAFLALCAYVVVIVFSTTDMDLLIGKGIKLPIVDVEVPITGFYAYVPYLVLLAHGNLLLQLQLLSRKLFAFDEVASQVGAPSGLHDQLHTFPFNYYLIGKPSSLVKKLLSFMVTATILLLPLLALLTLQVRFLAYQDEGITWAQRIAIWMDVGLLLTLWPVILDRVDSWKQYMTGAWQHVRVYWKGWLWWLLGIVVLSLTLINTEYAQNRYPTDPYRADLYRVSEQAAALQQEEQGLFTKAWEVITEESFAGCVMWGVLTGLVWLRRLMLRRATHGRDGKASSVQQVGLKGLVAVMLIGGLLPVLFTLDGEKFDHPAFLITRMTFSSRHLEAHEGRLFATPAKPEIVADLLSGDEDKRTAAMKAIEPIYLKNRNLRHANFSGAILPKADLRYADLRFANLTATFMREINGSPKINLQGASLAYAALQQAQLSGASLQGAALTGADLQGADLTHASLQGANLAYARLQGAQLEMAKLQGANLSLAQLQSTNLRGAELHGAQLEMAELQGAHLGRAYLQGVDLKRVPLHGVNLREARITWAGSHPSTVVNAIGVMWQPLSADDVSRLKEDASQWHWYSEKDKSAYLLAINGAAALPPSPPMLGSCLRDAATEIGCLKELSVDEYYAQLAVLLEELACQDSAVVHELLRRTTGIVFEGERMSGAVSRLEKRLAAKDIATVCPGVAALSEKDKQRLRNIAKEEREEQAASKPLAAAH